MDFFGFFGLEFDEDVFNRFIYRLLRKWVGSGENGEPEFVIVEKTFAPREFKGIGEDKRLTPAERETVYVGGLFLTLLVRGLGGLWTLLMTGTN